MPHRLPTLLCGLLWVAAFGLTSPTPVTTESGLVERAGGSHSCESYLFWNQLVLDGASSSHASSKGAIVKGRSYYFKAKIPLNNDFIKKLNDIKFYKERGAAEEEMVQQAEYHYALVEVFLRSRSDQKLSCCTESSCDNPGGTSQAGQAPAVDAVFWDVIPVKAPRQPHIDVDWFTQPRNAHHLPRELLRASSQDLIKSIDYGYIGSLKAKTHGHQVQFLSDAMMSWLTPQSHHKWYTDASLDFVEYMINQVRTQIREHGRS